MFFNSSVLFATTTVFATIIAFLTFRISYMQKKEADYHRKVDLFRLIHKCLEKDSARLIKETIIFYKKIMYEKSNDISVEAMLYKKGWMHEKETPLQRIDDINLNIVDFNQKMVQKQKQEQHLISTFRKTGILPFKTLKLSDNVAIHLDKYFKDLPTYSFIGETNDEKGTVLNLTIGTWLDFYNTCMCYGYETANDILFKRKNHKYDNMFFIRRKFDAFDYNNRFVSIGIVTLTIFKNVEDPENGGNPVNIFLLHKRSSKVAESQNLYNVVPAGSFQPTIEIINGTKNYITDDIIKLNIIREFAEELFAEVEFSELGNTESIKKHKLWDILKNNIYYLGRGFNPLNLYLEILTMAVIDLNTQPARDYFGVSKSKIQEKINSNYEGMVMLKEFKPDILDYYEQAYLAAPALRQIISIILSDYYSISKQLGLST